MRTAPRNVRPLHPLDLHITLAFLGDCDAGRCNAIWRLLSADPPPPWEARLALPRRFGSRSTAFGYPLTPTDIFLQWLRRRHQPLLEAAGVRHDPWPTQLHLTIAWQTGTENTESAAWLDRLRVLAQETVTLHGVAMYCRDDQPDGRRYRPIKNTGY